MKLKKGAAGRWLACLLALSMLFVSGGGQNWIFAQDSVAESETHKEARNASEPETKKQTEPKKETEPQTIAQTEPKKETEPQTAAQTEPKKETGSQTAAETETQKQTEGPTTEKPETEGQSETQKETEPQTAEESETQEQTEEQSAEESETQKETEPQTAEESETQEQTEDQTAAESETREETEKSYQTKFFCENNGVRADAVLSDEKGMLDKAVFVVEKRDGDYAASARSAVEDYLAANSMQMAVCEVYNVAFEIEGKETEPAGGTVSVDMKFDPGLDLKLPENENAMVRAYHIVNGSVQDVTTQVSLTDDKKVAGIGMMMDSFSPVVIASVTEVQTEIEEAMEMAKTASLLSARVYDPEKGVSVSQNKAVTLSGEYIGNETIEWTLTVDTNIFNPLRYKMFHAHLNDDMQFIKDDPIEVWVKDETGEQLKETYTWNQLSDYPGTIRLSFGQGEAEGKIYKFKYRSKITNTRGCSFSSYAYCGNYEWRDNFVSYTVEVYFESTPRPTPTATVPPSVKLEKWSEPRESQNLQKGEVITWTIRVKPEGSPSVAGVKIKDVIGGAQHYLNYKIYRTPPEGGEMGNPLESETIASDARGFEYVFPAQWADGTKVADGESYDIIVYTEVDEPGAFFNTVWDLSDLRTEATWVLPVLSGEGTTPGPADTPSPKPEATPTPTPTPLITPTPTANPTETPTPEATETPTPEPTETPTPEPTETPTPEPTETPTPEPTETPTPEPTETPTPEPTETPTPEPTETPTPEPTETPTPEPTETPTPEPTETPTPEPTPTATPEPTETPTPEPTETPTPEPTPTATPEPTETPTPEPTETPTPEPTETPTPEPTPTATPEPTPTATPEPTPTATPEPTPTATPEPTPTVTPEPTPTATPEPTETPTPEPTPTATPEPTPTATPEPTETPTPEPTETPTPEPTETPTPEPTPTATPEPTPTATPEPTETPTPEPTETPTPEPTETPTPEPTETPTPEPTETVTPEPTPTATPEPTETPTPEPTETPTPEPTETPTPEPTETPTPEPTETPTPEPTETPTPEPTETPAGEKTASIYVTKELFFDERLIAAPDETFYVALYEDEECTQRVSNVSALRFVNESSSTAVFENIERGKTYYVGECDADGNVKYTGSVSDGTVYAVHYIEGQTVSVQNNNDNASLYFRNEFYDLPARYTFVKDVNEPEDDETELETEFEIEKSTDAPKAASPEPTAAPTPATGHAAKTGDDTNYALYLVLLAAAAVMAGAAYREKRKKGNL